MSALHLKRLSLLTLGIAICLVYLSSGCAPAVGVFRTAAPAGVARAPSAVRIYMDEKSAPRGYQELGLVIANTHIFIPVNLNFDTQFALAVQAVRRGNVRDTQVFRALVARAARLGADALIIKNFSKAGTNLSISAVAIRTRCIRRPACAPAPAAPAPPAPAAPAPPTPVPPTAPPAMCPPTSPPAQCG